MALTPTDVDELYDNAKKLLEFWMKIKLVFNAAFSDGEITREHEAGYLQLKSEISRIYRIIADKLPVGLKFDGEKALEMLKTAMSMEHLQKLIPAERQNQFKTWHLVYIRLTRTLGALEIMKQGYFPHLHRQRLPSRNSVDAGNKSKVGLGAKK